MDEESDYEVNLRVIIPQLIVSLEAHCLEKTQILALFAMGVKWYKRSRLMRWVLSFNFDNEVLKNLALSVIITLVLLLARILAVRAMGRSRVPPEAKRRFIVQIKNSSYMLFVLLLLVIWGSELRTFAVSLVAIAAAVVIATKEILLCIMGGILRTTNQLFNVGDRIEVGGAKGDVIDHNFLVTKLYEIGPGKEFHQFTGRVVNIPNSIFLSQVLINETAVGRFVLHVFRVTIPNDEAVKEKYDRLLQIACAACAEYMDEARSHFARLSRKEGLEVPNLQPRITVSINTKDSIEFVVRIPVRSGLKGRIEQMILLEFLKIPDRKKS